MENLSCGEPLPLYVGGAHSFDCLLAAGGYTEIDPCITEQNFPLSAGATRRVMCRLIQFLGNPTTNEVFDCFSQCGLTHPTHEHALAFGAQHHDYVMMPIFGRKGPIVFLHEPWKCPRKNQGVIILTGWLGNTHFPEVKSLSLEWLNLPHAPGTPLLKDENGDDIPIHDDLGYGWRNCTNRWQACWGTRFLAIEG